jgi:hypothetical protein
MVGSTSISPATLTVGWLTYPPVSQRTCAAAAPGAVARGAATGGLGLALFGGLWAAAGIEGGGVAHPAVLLTVDGLVVAGLLSPPALTARRPGKGHHSRDRRHHGCPLLSPLASIFRVRLYHVTATALTILAMAVLVVVISGGNAVVPSSYGVLGLGAALILWITAVAILRQVFSLTRLDVPVAPASPGMVGPAVSKAGRVATTRSGVPGRQRSSVVR